MISESNRRLILVYAPIYNLFSIKHDFLVSLLNRVETSNIAQFILVLWLKSNDKGEHGSNTPLGSAHDITSEFFDDVLANVQPKADALGIDFFGGIQETEELE